MEQSYKPSSKRNGTDMIGKFLKFFIFAFISLLTTTEIEQHLLIGDLHPVAYNVVN